VALLASVTQPMLILGETALLALQAMGGWWPWCNAKIRENAT